MSKFLASVVIAAIGIIITVAIHQAQLAASKSNSESQIQAENVRAEAQRRLQQGQVTGQLLQHLTSEHELERTVAIVALRNSVTATIYDEVVLALAQDDESEKVRNTAIAHLAASNDPGVAAALSQIAQDEGRSDPERSRLLLRRGQCGTRRGPSRCQDL